MPDVGVRMDLRPGGTIHCVLYYLTLDVRQTVEINKYNTKSQ